MGAGQAVLTSASVVCILAITALVTVVWRKGVVSRRDETSEDRYRREMSDLRARRRARPSAPSRSVSAASDQTAPEQAAAGLSIVGADDLAEAFVDRRGLDRFQRQGRWLNVDPVPRRITSRARRKGVWAAGGAASGGSPVAGTGCSGGHGSGCGGGGCGGGGGA